MFFPTTYPLKGQAAGKDSKSLITFLACLTIAVSSQSLIPTKFGIKAGLNFSNLSISSVDGVKPTINSSQIGVAAGVCIYIPLSDKWYINPELIYSQKGASFDYNFTHDYPDNQRAEYATTNQLVLSYIELNPTFSFQASDKIALNFGPSLSFLISQAESSTKELTDGVDATAPNVLLDGFYESNVLDVGLNVGLSYFLTESLLLDTRVYTGFMEAGTINQPYPEVLDISGNQVVPDAEYVVKNRAVVISLGYLF